MEGIISNALKFEAFITPIVVILLLLGVALYFWKQSGTSYGIKSRLYSLLSGSKEFDNPALTELWNKQKDIERFNALFNLNAKTIEEVIAFKLWSEKYSLDIKRFSIIKPWFDINTLKVKKASKGAIYFLIFLIVVMYITSILIFRFCSYDSVLIKFQSNEQWLWLDSKEVRSLDLMPFKSKDDKWKLNTSQCSAESFNPEAKGKEIGIDTHTVQVLCESFNNDEDKKFISDALSSQKKLGWFAVFLLVWTLVKLRSLYKNLSIYTARKHLLKQLKLYRMNLYSK